MKVLFAVSNDKMSESIVKQYQKDYKQIITQVSNEVHIGDVKDVQS